MAGSTVSAAIELDAGAEAAFDTLLEELRATLARFGVRFEPGPEGRVVEGDVEVGRVAAWKPGERVTLEWRSADWADEQSELEIHREGALLSVELRGFGGALGDEVPGWFAGEVAAPLLAAAAPRRLGDWLTDRAARSPTGAAARAAYRDPTHHRPSFGAVLVALALGLDDVLLEIGCGGGAFLQAALRSGCSAAGVDHSPEMVQVARELNADAIQDGRLELVQAEAESLPFPDDRFTCAAMMQVFFFFADPAAVLGECRRVLQPGGRLVVFTLSEAARGTPAAPEPMASRGHFHTDEELSGFARSAGFAQATVEHPDLEPHARAAGLPDDVVALFGGDPAGGQLLVAR